MNKATLEALKYEVIEVPALPPEINLNQTYYPTLLNALTLRTTDGRFLILAPYYPQLDQYVQFNAYKIIRKAFGDNAQVVPIDCAAAATLQGAVHCLTATVPYRYSRFSSSGATAPTKDVPQAQK